MSPQTLTPEQLDNLKEVESPLIRRRYVLFYQLPQELQETMLSEQVTSTVWRITREKYGLPDNDLTKVARIIGLVVLGELPVKDLIKELANKLQIDISKASAIAQDINQLIFQPVRESLMAVHGIVEADKTRIQPVSRSGSVAEPPPVPAPVQPKPQQVRKPEPVGLPPTIKEEVSEQRRQELIERLKQPKGTNERKRGNGVKGPVTTAWNGRTIDLTKIPPRRETNNGAKKNGVRYLDPKDLYES